MVYASMDSEGLHVVDSEISKELEGKNLSPSLITGIEGCPARWFTQSFVLPKFIDVDMTAAIRGSAFHWVMEEFFALLPEKRSKKKIASLAKQVMSHVDKRNDFKKFFEEKPDQKIWLRDAIRSYYDMGAKPELVKIAEIERGGEVEEGIEIFVKGRIGDTDREVLGFVDRVREGRDGVIVEDWKTGARARQWNPNLKSEEGLAEQRQQMIYTKLLRDEGVEVSAASLIYPVAQEVVRVYIDNPRLDEIVTKDVEKADRDLTAMINENTFEYNPSFCPWCPLVNVCPEAKVFGNSPKIRDAISEQPAIGDLAKGIEFQ